MNQLNESLTQSKKYVWQSPVVLVMPLSTLTAGGHGDMSEPNGGGLWTT